MLNKLLKNSRYFHLKLIYQHPKGIQNRFKDNADKWVQSLKDPNVKTYYDLFLNGQTEKYEVKLTLTDQEQSYVKKLKHVHRPGIGAMDDFWTYFHEKRPDDYQMSRDVQALSLKDFVKQGKQNITDVHKLVLTVISFIVLQTGLYFGFVHNKQLPKNQRVKVLNAQFLQTYHFQKQENDIKQIIGRIKIVNDQYQKQLSQSKLAK